MQIYLKEQSEGKAACLGGRCVLKRRLQTDESIDFGYHLLSSCAGLTYALGAQEWLNTHDEIPSLKWFQWVTPAFFFAN